MSGSCWSRPGGFDHTEAAVFAALCGGIGWPVAMAVIAVYRGALLLLGAGIKPDPAEVTASTERLERLNDELRAKERRA